MAKVELLRGDFEGWGLAYRGPLFHACLCDPPYGLNFMGKEWDAELDAEVWGRTLRGLLRPGALALMFGGTRTWHRLAFGMEQAGFEVWDTLMWLYGNGFPKGQDVGLKIDAAMGQATPREVRATTSRTKEVWGQYKTGSASVGEPVYNTPEGKAWAGWRTPALKPAWEPVLAFRLPDGRNSAQRALTDGTGALAIESSRVGDEPAGWGGATHGWTRSGATGGLGAGEPRPKTGRYPANLALDPEAGALLDTETPGQPSRFFYCTKASTAERNAGLEGTESSHPCHKPIALCKWLAALLLPSEAAGTRRLLVPFAGTGSEMIGAALAGWDEVVGVECEAEYVEIGRKRLAGFCALDGDRG